MRKLALISISIMFGLAGCGNDDDAETPVETVAETAAPAETVAAETAAPVETAAAETAAAAETTAAADAPAAGYTLAEWSVEGAAQLTAGPNEFSVANAGKNGHEFLIVKGTYETVAKNELGTVQEDQLADGDVVFKIEKIEPGASAPVSVDLPAGNYVFLCNIEFGPNSHAGKGQVLDVTVA